MSSLQALQDLVHEKYGIEASALDPNESMREKGFDSLALVEFIFAVEDRFSIRLPDDDPNLDTLAQLAVLVDKTLAAKAAQPAKAGDAAQAAPVEIQQTAHSAPSAPSA